MSIEAIVGLVVGLLTIGGSLAGLAVAWGRLGARTAQMEKDVAKFEALREKIATIDQMAKELSKFEALRETVTAVDSRQRESAKSQGERLERAAIELAVLTGKFDGFERGRRSRTAATGHAIPQAPGKTGP